MRKTSLYLSEAETRRLAELAALEGRSQAEIVRRAIAAYVPQATDDRDFRFLASGAGDGSSIADVPEEELLEGFGS